MNFITCLNTKKEIQHIYYGFVSFLNKVKRFNKYFIDRNLSTRDYTYVKNQDPNDYFINTKNCKIHGCLFYRCQFYNCFHNYSGFVCGKEELYINKSYTRLQIDKNSSAINDKIWINGQYSKRILEARQNILLVPCDIRTRNYSEYNEYFPDNNLVRRFKGIKQPQCNKKMNPICNGECKNKYFFKIFISNNASFPIENGEYDIGFTIFEFYQNFESYYVVENITI